MLRAFRFHRHHVKRVRATTRLKETSRARRLPGRGGVDGEADVAARLPPDEGEGLLHVLHRRVVQHVDGDGAEGEPDVHAQREHRRRPGRLRHVVRAAAALDLQRAPGREAGRGARVVLHPPHGDHGVAGEGDDVAAVVVRDVDDAVEVAVDGGEEGVRAVARHGGGHLGVPGHVDEEHGDVAAPHAVHAPARLAHHRNVRHEAPERRVFGR
mmetsp:Transcript_16449/g.51037  ORF Transcript_16449/g.51037 Transcript_16449/m.51037 type:complete len:212 (+) Transcript_16449:1086-1721(+)